LGLPVPEKANPPIDLAQPPFAVLIVGVFAAIAVARGPGHDLCHRRAFSRKQELELVPQSLQAARRDVVLHARGLPVCGLFSAVVVLVVLAIDLLRERLAHMAPRIQSRLDVLRKFAIAKQVRYTTARVQGMDKRLYMVVERFRDAPAVYRRFRERGRMAPEGLRYVSSWVDDQIERCFQIMETHDRRLLDEWMANWSDLTDFEVYPVITSAEAAERIAPRL
jgi:hypothetical protein